MEENTEQETVVQMITGRKETAAGGAQVKKHIPYTAPADKECYFEDGRTRIDFVLVYEEKGQEEKESGTKKRSETRRSMKKAEEVEKKKQWRAKYLKGLSTTGLLMEVDKSEGDQKAITFLKLSAPWKVLCKYAEEMLVRVPLEVQPKGKERFAEKVLAGIRLLNPMRLKIPNAPLEYYTCQFRESRLDRFLGHEYPETFFKTTDRQRIVWEILQNTVYGREEKAEVGVKRLLQAGVFSAAYPLHDGPHVVEKGTPKEKLNNRQILHKYWARWGMWYKYQPLDKIREYFGEKVAIYFAWLGFYTAFLLPVAIVGLAVFIYSVLTISSNVVAKEVCNEGNKYLMCPLCDSGCPFWKYSEACIFVTVTHLFDNIGTVFFAVFVSLWAVTFLEYWKRTNASLAHHWDVMGFEDEEERLRPEYQVLAPKWRTNPITGRTEPYFPKMYQRTRRLTALNVLLLMMFLVVAFILGVIIYRVLIAIPLFRNKHLRRWATTIASISSSLLNLVFILVMGWFYKAVALKFTEWEMHRTQTEFDDNYTFKVFLFQFVNFYSSIIYIGFFKGKIIGYPGNYQTLFGARAESCPPGGCLIELAQQLGVIMVGKQVLNNAQEFVLPKLKAIFIRRKSKDLRADGHMSRWEKDYQKVPNQGMFDEYLEMVIQFGFITVFVAAFPLAPLFALLNNWIEIRLDAQKFVCETRRPVAERAEDIGVWFTILGVLTQLAVISNAFLIAFTSEFLPKILYRSTYGTMSGYTNHSLSMAPNGTETQPCFYQDFRTPEGEYREFYWRLLAIRLGFVIVFEHFVFFFGRMIDLMIPDIPKELDLKIKREAYLAKRAMQGADDKLTATYEEDESSEEDIDGAF